jgi:hypothetical protein
MLIVVERAGAMTPSHKEIGANASDAPTSKKKSACRNSIEFDDDIEVTLSIVSVMLRVA